MTLEHRLKKALASPDPDADFTARVLGRLDAAGAAPAREATRMRRGTPGLALAAGVVLATLAGVLLHQQRERDRGEAAAGQLALALEVTSRELQDLHHRLDQLPSGPPQEQEP